MRLSTSKQIIVTSDSTGILTAWKSVSDASKNARECFSNHMSKPLEIASPRIPLAPFDSNMFVVEIWAVLICVVDRPLNAVGLPHYNLPLLSSLLPTLKGPPHHLTPALSIPPELLATIRQMDYVGYAPHQRTLLRNQCVEPKKTARKKFRSELRGKRENMPLEGMELKEGGIPLYYQPVEIAYSRFGVEDFDFGFLRSPPLWLFKVLILFHCSLRPVSTIKRDLPALKRTLTIRTATLCFNSCTTCHHSITLLRRTWFPRVRWISVSLVNWGSCFECWRMRVVPTVTRGISWLPSQWTPKVLGIAAPI